MKVLFLKPARDEFLSAVDFYEKQARGLGADLSAEITETIDTIKGNPAS